MITIIDTDPSVFESMRKAFEGTDVAVIHGNITEAKTKATVSPANSFGFMDGGLDLALRDFFGEDVEREVKLRIRKDRGGELLVGDAMVVPTYHAEIPWLIVAPTMRVPMAVDRTVNAYLAMRAILRVAGTGDIWPITVPGLCTFSGRMPHPIAARQMRAAWDDHWKQRVFPTAREAVEYHAWLAGAIR